MSQLWRTLKSSISALRSPEDHYGKAFLIAADTGDLDKMLEHIGSRGVSYRDEYGQRPLHRASRRGHAAAVRMLLEYGSDPNACDHVGAYTAIQYAAHYQHSEVVRLLVSYGADVYYQNRIACRPATYYAHKYPSVRTAIQQGISDLIIHRSIAASFLIEHLPPHIYFVDHNSLALKHSIVLLVVEFIPRHQLWTENKTRYITNKTTNWHSSDLFSEKHLEREKMNTIHSCKYHGEFDVDKDWEAICKAKQKRDVHRDSECSDCSDSDYYDEEEEEKYHESDTDEYHSNTSQSVSSSTSSYKSLSDDDAAQTNNDTTRVVHRKKRRTRRMHHRRRNHYRHRVIRNDNLHSVGGVLLMNNSYLRNGVLLLLLTILIVFVAVCVEDIDMGAFTQIIAEWWSSIQSVMCE
eukprot:243710_1